MFTFRHRIPVALLAIQDRSNDLENALDVAVMVTIARERDETVDMIYDSYPQGNDARVPNTQIGIEWNTESNFHRLILIYIQYCLF